MSIEGLLWDVEEAGLEKHKEGYQDIILKWIGNAVVIESSCSSRYGCHVLVEAPSRSRLGGLLAQASVVGGARTGPDAKLRHPCCMLFR